MFYFRLQNKLKELQSLQDAQVLRPTLDDSSLQEKHIQDLTLDITRVIHIIHFIFKINLVFLLILFIIYYDADICFNKKNNSTNPITFKWTIWQQRIPIVVQCVICSSVIITKFVQ